MNPRAADRALARIHPPVVLAYHGVGDVARADDSHLRTHPDEVRSHIRMLKRRGYRFSTAEELLAWGDGGPPGRVATLTFDDGWRDGLDRVAPILADLGVRATFYVNPGRWGGQHPDVAGGSGRLLDEPEAAELHRLGMELGSHSLTHPDLRALDDDALRHEIQASKAAIEAVTGRACLTFAYPFGLFDARVARVVAAAGHELAFGWRRGPWERFAAPRIPAPTRRGGWALRLKMRGVRKPGRPG